MKRAQKIKALALGLCYIFSFGLFNVGLAYADTKPYFQVRGGDAFAGGWFLAKSSTTNQFDCDVAGNYQAPSFSGGTASNQYKGGILAFTQDTNLTKGARAEFGAFSLGTIEGNSAKNYGFASADGAVNNKLSFANKQVGYSVGSSWGGFLDGGLRQVHHCIKDYFTIKQESPGNWPPGGSVGNVGPGQYESSTRIDLNGGAVGAGESITLFVDGDVYIKSDITYDNHTANDVPKFALVAKGNIFIDNDVGRLDGLYIAQPDPSSGNNGVIWTCAIASSAPNGNDVSRDCRTKSLTVNGALIAKQVNLTRVSGDIGTDTAAETINYTPETVIGGPIFNTAPNTEFKIESLISLPPVY